MLYPNTDVSPTLGLSLKAMPANIAQDFLLIDAFASNAQSYVLSYVEINSNDNLIPLVLPQTNVYLNYAPARADNNNLPDGTVLGQIVNISANTTYAAHTWGITADGDNWTNIALLNTQYAAGVTLIWTSEGWSAVSAVNSTFSP